MYLAIVVSITPCVASPMEQLIENYIAVGRAFGLHVRSWVSVVAASMVLRMEACTASCRPRSVFSAGHSTTTDARAIVSVHTLAATMISRGTLFVIAGVYTGEASTTLHSRRQGIASCTRFITAVRPGPAREGGQVIIYEWNDG
ncbi:hypothetical protein C8Q74DRAFT_877968 [Fomes fomentarius]|nr:hypothetical protein C8Q74DRAFT_877968 [Fomes fomentarius]